MDGNRHGRRDGRGRLAPGLALRLLHLHRKTVEPMRAGDSGRRDGAAIFDELAARVAEIGAEKAARQREAGHGKA